jgi:hypothetical protein
MTSISELEENIKEMSTRFFKLKIEEVINECISNNEEYIRVDKLKTKIKCKIYDNSNLIDYKKCKGFTKKNKPCQKNASKNSKYCYLHEDQDESENNNSIKDNNLNDTSNVGNDNGNGNSNGNSNGNGDGIKIIIDNLNNSENVSNVMDNLNYNLSNEEIKDKEDIKRKKKRLM